MNLFELLTIALLPTFTTALEALTVDGNPHDAPRAACCPAQRLPPETLLPPPIAASLSVQADTFVKVRSRKHLDIPVEVFTFRQPARLSDLTLPFDLALVSGVDPSGLVEVPTPSASAADSWFPDYSWTHYVVCLGGTDETARHQHLGWRFTKKQGHESRPGPETFVALIVTGREEAEAEAEAAGRVRVRVADAQRDGGEADEEPLTSLPVGVEAPGWMAAMVAAVTARVVKA